MNHSVYTGSFTALEKRFVEDVLQLRSEDALSEINVLVGSNVLATYLKRRIALAGQAIANLRFHTFLDMVKRVTPYAGMASGKPNIPELGRMIVLERILKDRTPTAFSSISGFSGFRDSLLETFRDLRDAEITPENLEKEWNTGTEQGREQHLAALLDLYRRYKEKIGEFQGVDDKMKPVGQFHLCCGARGGLL